MLKTVLILLIYIIIGILIFQGIKICKKRHEDDMCVSAGKKIICKIDGIYKIFP